MTGTGAPSRDRVNRRSVLATVGTGASLATAGCAGLFSHVSSLDDQLSVTITTVPDDDDRQSNGIFKYLETALEAAGIDVGVELRTTAQLQQKVLVDQEFDIFVARHPGFKHPDGLYELLHSRFASEPGWQNPYGVTHMDLDEHLEAQRHLTGEERTAAIGDALDIVLKEKPFVPVCAPSTYYAVNPEQFGGWDRQTFRTRLGFVDLDPADGVDAFTGLVTDSRPTVNLNPLAVQYRRTGVYTSLLYDSLATESNGDLIPWLASDWEWADDRVTATLRPDVTFHDGESLTATDVAFTFDFLEDLSLGRAESPIPASRFRRHTSTVETVTPVDDETVEITVSTNRTVGASALTVPILPEHVWRPIVTELEQETASTGPWLREELHAETIPRTGSGPYRFDGWTQGDQVTFTRFDEHFAIDDPDLPSAPVDQLQVQSAPNGSTAIGLVDRGDATALVTPIESHVVGETESTETAKRISDPNWAFYQVGFNTREPPFSNFRFRQAVASLIDREWLASEVFHGHARPIAVPDMESAAIDDYTWNGADPETPFVGTDGEVDVEAARDLFEVASYRYNDEGELVVND
ncbi:ABC transporter substrate-binding protein [Halovivax cerinus]|uniref:ABC transporter substrate-binding protein n=1 Tax=Halovivax cerinus TaxID=1487865 RepID=A0ABD5NJT2_9EURY|nr:ABC transporter substrate-binding protein [Halovivax cerinus]